MSGRRILSAVLEAAGLSVERSPDGVAQVHQTEQSGCGAVFCSWCSNFIRLERGLAMGEVSHGICEGCAEKHFSDGAMNQETAALGGPPHPAATVCCKTGFLPCIDPQPLIEAAMAERPKVSLGGVR